MSRRRVLSVHVEHETLLRLEAAGLDEALAQRIIESRGNELAKKIICLISQNQSLAWWKAREILGAKNFFGPDEWERFFGDRFQFESIPEIPWSQVELESPGINQEHFLFLGLDCLDGKPLNLPTWHKVCSGESHPKFHSDWYLSDSFAQKTGDLRWYLMTVGIVEGSTYLSYSRQEALLPQEYGVPSGIERVNANVLYYLLNGKYLDIDFWSRTCDTMDSGGRVLVRGYSGGGLGVSYWFDSAVSFVGVPASRKFQG